MSEPGWDMGCGHFDSYGDPNHDCSKWNTRGGRFENWLLRMRVKWWPW